MISDMGIVAKARVAHSTVTLKVPKVQGWSGGRGLDYLSLGLQVAMPQQRTKVESRLKAEEAEAGIDAEVLR